MEALSFGFRVIVPGNRVGDVTEGLRWATLRDVGRRYADVSNPRACLERIATLPSKHGVTDL